MLGSGEDTTVTCIACGSTVDRAEAREYDKHGDRWDREEKDFEYLCKPCDRERNRIPRDGLEELLVTCGAGDVSTEEFLGAYVSEVQRRHKRDRQ
jgi:hypothetical protein